jgi:hypothetical protein
MKRDPIETEELEPEPEPETAIALRSPAIPTTIAELASLKGEALEILEARVQILATLHKSALRMTSPSDWVLFKSPEEHGGQVVGYLQDCGAERVRDLYGIEIFDITVPQKIQGATPAEFFYVITGAGRCSITRQTVEAMEGGRASTEDFCKDKRGADLELAVRKAARANLDGNITRELAGLKSVPLEEIAEAWKGTNKAIDQCRRGRGFGTRDARLGATAAEAAIDPPICPVCNKPMLLRNGQKGKFYSCRDWKDHGRQAKTWNLEDWLAELKRRQAAAPATAEASSAGPEPPPVAGKVDRVLDADEIFGPSNGRRREPGEEG